MRLQLNGLQHAEAAREDTAALMLTRNSGERALLEERALDLSSSSRESKVLSASMTTANPSTEGQPAGRPIVMRNGIVPTVVGQRTETHGCAGGRRATRRRW